ncbi:hypothetical protein [Paraburkholderia sp. J12]|uniref:hypothetical protein n=1 Tax=Paraburkholderia sp. J12 TaxID=2805432 RepID=UPI002ABEA0C4|nr:hypothetical protein [Paraburkholderia sp. J12]
MFTSQSISLEDTLPGELRNVVEDRDAPASARASLLVALEARIHRLCASAEIEQTGPDCFRVTAPPEVIMQLVKAKDRAPALACTVVFFERRPQPFV